MDSEGYLTGASGTCIRTRLWSLPDFFSASVFPGARLQVNKEWANPSGQWRVGFKHVFDLFPGQLVKRVSVSPPPLSGGAGARWRSG